MTVPVYIAEVSPSHQRGQLVTINSLFITGGQFIASLIDGAFSYLGHDSWRYLKLMLSQCCKLYYATCIDKILNYLCLMKLLWFSYSVIIDTHQRPCLRMNCS